MGEGKRPHILIIDDEPAIADSLTMLLEPAGYRVTAATDARKALSMGLEDPPDLVICDIVMPEMDGIEFVRALRKREPQLPVIVMSGNPVGRQFLDAARMLGASATIAKPFSFDELKQTIGKALNPPAS